MKDFLSLASRRQSDRAFDTQRPVERKNYSVFWRRRVSRRLLVIPNLGILLWWMIPN